MARPKRRKLKFDEESVNALLQEIYNDTHRIRQRITTLFTKWENQVNDRDEVAAIGEQIVKLITAEAKTQDQKITLLKYLKDVVYDKNKQDNESDDKNKEVDSEKRNELIEMVQKEMNKDKK